MSDLDDDELKATRKLMEEKPQLRGGIHLVEGWEYDHLIGIYKKELKRIREDNTLTKDEQNKQKAIVNEQIESLKKSFDKRSNKTKYSRNDYKKKTNEMIKKFEEER